ncbi:hypothetical protein MMC07_007884 [Pseudocyphellaria aurata]|nr:hypothetical protein [Pseudocyphellaria aurata]
MAAVESEIIFLSTPDLPDYGKLSVPGAMKKFSCLELPTLNPPARRRKLRSRQIYFIGVGGIIGLGFFANSSLILGIAGPGGALLAFALVGLMSIAVMEGICEMIVLWPISNAMVEFVRTFVDEDLAIVVGVGYWYTYSVTFTALIVGAANLAGWAWRPNWVEKYDYSLPLGLRKPSPVEKTNKATSDFNEGIQNNPNVAHSHFTAICVSIPLATFSYLGVELITMTAFEAQNPTELKYPAKNMAWTITVIYMLTTLVFVLNVGWNDPSLPKFYNQGLADLTGDVISPTVVTRTMHESRGNTAVALNALRTHSAPVIAAIRAQIGILPGIITACFIYSALSAANTALYVASRALFGLTRDIQIERGSGRIIRAIAKMATVESRTQSPWWALLCSVLVLFWLPFVHISGNYTKEELQEILIDIGSVSCVLVWSSQCLAFICYYRWLKRHEPQLTGDFARFKRSSSASHLAFFQPLIAWIGLLSTLAIVFFNSVSLWTGKSKVTKCISAFLSPLILILVWVGLKFRRKSINRKWYVQLETWQDFSAALRRLDNLRYLVNDPVPVNGLELQRMDNPSSHPPDSPGAVNEDTHYHPSGFIRESGPNMNGSAPTSPTSRSQGQNAHHSGAVDDDQYSLARFKSTGGLVANGAINEVAGSDGHLEQPDSSHELQTMDAHRRYQFLLSRVDTSLSS